jgi:outer membrane protein OmpA-like peptidoglycan-associated protein/ABC-type nitrate/sulfonate/bicarbonate transport system substrate-binding protein
MKKGTKFALLLLVLGLLLIGAYKLIMNWVEDDKLANTSEAKTITTRLKIGGDSYLGYWFLQSGEMKRLCGNRGIGIEFTDDKGAYAERLKKFANKEYEMIVLPINSYLQHAAVYNYPGVIVAAIAESKGADGIVGWKNKFPKGKVQELNNANLRIAFTPDSPSEFLLDLTATDFDLQALKTTQDWRVTANGSEELAKLIKPQTADAFVLWEPELSQSLEQHADLQLIWDSAKFSGYIVDVFVVHRDYLHAHPKEVKSFFESYFLALKSYDNSREQMLREIVLSTGLDRERVAKILAKINWFDIDENARLEFGIAQQNFSSNEGILNTINACESVLRRTGKLKGDPLKGNPYSIIYSGIIKELTQSLPANPTNDPATASFTPLDDEQWATLSEVGPLRVEPITFQQGSNLLDDAGKQYVDEIAELFKNQYPRYRIKICGHTGPGDAEENKILSQARAEAVRTYLSTVHNLEAQRFQVLGMGSTQPPPQKPGESLRALQYRMPRVEFILMEGNNL